VFHELCCQRIDLPDAYNAIIWRHWYTITMPSRPRYRLRGGSNALGVTYLHNRLLLTYLIDSIRIHMPRSPLGVARKPSGQWHSIQYSVPASGKCPVCSCLKMSLAATPRGCDIIIWNLIGVFLLWGQISHRPAAPCQVSLSFT